MKNPNGVMYRADPFPRETANEEASKRCQDGESVAVVQPFGPRGGYIVLPLAVAERSGLTIVGEFK